MEPHKQLAPIVRQFVKRVETSPKVARMMESVDTGVHFMIDREYKLDNPALAATRGPLVAGLWVMLAIVLLAFIWGALAPIDSAAVARGNVVLLSNKKTIQHLEGGLIEEILVKEGDLVKPDQPLVRLRDTAAVAQRETLQGQLWVARATEARLIAERDGLEEIQFDAEMLKQSEDNTELAKAIAAQKRLFESQRDAQAAKLGALRQRIAQANEQVSGIKAQIESIDGQLALIVDEVGSVQNLYEKGYATKPRLLSLKRRQEELGGNRGQYESEVAKVGQKITETEMEIINLENEYAAKNSSDLRDTQVKIVDLEERLSAAQDIALRTLITAPTGGIVTGLKYHTIGGVVQPGTPIMDLIPQDDQLVIEARVQPGDIDVVHAGMDAKVVLTAYKARSTPRLPGKVTQVSADKFTDERGLHAESYYIARVEVDKSYLEKSEAKLELYPGMPADVLIRTGSRSFLSYLFKPITDSVHRAFREE